MPPTDSQFGKLEHRVKALEDRGPLQIPNSLQSTPTPKSWSFSFVLAVVGGLMGIASFVGGGVWVVHTEVSRIDQAIEKIDKRMVNLTMAIKVLGDAQGGKTKELVDDALTIAQAKAQAGDVQAAARIVNMANELIAEEKQKRQTAPQEFFQNALANYKTIWEKSSGRGPAAQKAFQGTVELAEYRSAITLPPQNFHPAHEYKGQKRVSFGEMATGPNGYLLLRDAALYGPNAIQRGPGPGFDIDGTDLENVVFYNSIISYRGAPAILKNVWFVNCTFLVSESVNGNKLLQVAALAESSARIG